MAQPGPADGGSTFDSVGRLLKQVSVALRTSLDGALRPVGLTTPQYVCLQALAERPDLSGAELARSAFVSRQSMHELLGGLERRGLVERLPPIRGREQPARLTERGRAGVAAADALVRDVDRAMLAPLAEEEERALRAGLQACLAALGELGARR